MAESNDEGLARARRLLSFALLASLATLKALLAYGSVRPGPDAAYYLEVARNVRDGHGLVSWISMYHAGVETLPHPTPIYPLWPLFLGYIGRVVPLEPAGVWVPTTLSFFAVILGARYVRGLWPRPLLPGVWEVPDAGHLLILLLGFNPLFLEFSAQAYTEPLGFCLLFWALDRARPLFAGTAGPGRAFEIGVYAGLLILVRAQMFLFTLVLAAAFAFAVLMWRPRGAWLRLAGVAAGGWALALAPQLAWLSTFYPGPLGLGALLRFERFRASELLSPVQMLIRFDDPLAWARDRAQGFVIAFRSTGEYAYEPNFGLIHWAPLLAAAVWLPVVVQRRSWPAFREALRTPSAVGNLLVYALLALGGFFSIHTLHKSYGAEWNFATRHALTVMFLFAGGVVALGARAGAARVLAIVLVTLSVRELTRDARRLVNAAETELSAPTIFRPGAVDFFERALAADPELVVVSEQATRFAWELPGVRFHWIWVESPYADMDALFRERGADYLVAYRGSPMRVYTDPAFAENYVKLPAEYSGMVIYRRDPEAAARLAAEAAAAPAEPPAPTGSATPEPPTPEGKADPAPAGAEP